jgi:hypothetical protein
MVSITIVLAAVLWLAVTGMVTPWHTEKLTVLTESPHIQTRDINGTFYWDATVVIDKVTPQDEQVIWGELWVIIKSFNGSLLDASMKPTIDNPGGYDDDIDGSVDIEAWFIETQTGDVKMSGGDGVKLTGLTRAYEGATVDLIVHQEKIASFSLPTAFS